MVSPSCLMTMPLPIRQLGDMPYRVRKEEIKIKKMKKLFRKITTIGETCLFFIRHGEKYIFPINGKIGFF